MELVLESVGEGICGVDTAGRTTFVNRAAVEMLGWSEAELVGRPQHEVIHHSRADGRPYAVSACPIHGVFAEGGRRRVTGEVFWRKDGSSFPVEYSVTGIRHEGVMVGAVVVFRDLSERADRVEQERELAVERVARTRAERERERSEFLAEASASLFSTLDHEQALEKLARLSVPRLADWCAIDLAGEEGLRRVVVAHRDPELEALAWEYHERYPPERTAARGLYRVVRTGQPELVKEADAEAAVRDGADPERVAASRELGLRSYMILPLNAYGRTFGALTLARGAAREPYDEEDLLFARDLATRAALAADAARLYGDARRNEERYRALAGELERRNAELDQFAYVASHDLKAPLRGIANLATWLEEDLGEAMTEQTRRHLELLRGRVHRMEGLIGGILEYSRAGRTGEQPERVDTRALVEQVVDLLTPPEGTSVEVVGEMPVIDTERTPLQQVFLNLVGNALKYGGAGVRVEVSAREVDAQRVEFAVSDDGPGIHPEHHERIFAMFQTLRPRDEVEGTGIGLSVVKKHVEGWGGVVTVESDEGQGATFRFTWPRRPPDHGAHPA